MHKLRIKYGLEFSEPTEEQARRWAIRTRELIRTGVAPEPAGDKAAREIFRTYQTRFYKAEADTIYDLLNEILGQ